jgi:hypothetical protein
MNERISLFDLTTLSFELCPYKHYMSQAFFSSKNQTITKFVKHRFLGEKGWTIPHEKCPFLLPTDFLVKEITNLTSYFT